LARLKWATPLSRLWLDYNAAVNAIKTTGTKG